MDPLLQALKDPGAASTVDAFKRVVQNAILAQRSLRTELDLVQGLRPEPPIGAAPDAPKGETGPFVLDAPATTPLQTARPSIIEVAHAVTPSETDRLAVEALLVAIEATKHAPIHSEGGGVRVFPPASRLAAPRVQLLPSLAPEALCDGAAALAACACHPHKCGEWRRHGSTRRWRAARLMRDTEHMARAKMRACGLHRTSSSSNAYVGATLRRSFAMTNDIS